MGGRAVELIGGITGGTMDGSIGGSIGAGLDGSGGESLGNPVTKALVCVSVLLQEAEPVEVILGLFCLN